MNKHLLAVAIAAVVSVSLAGCSSGGDSDDDAPATTTPPAGGNQGADQGGAQAGGDNGGNTAANRPVGPVTAPSGGGAATGETSAGVYTGDFGFGDGFEQGVFVVDNEFNLVGLSINGNGNAKSVFGSVGAESMFQGSMREYDHRASQSTASTNGSFGASGAEASVIGPFGLTFTPGVSIEGSDQRGVALSIAGSLMPATLATVAGTWTAENQYGDCAATAAGEACSLETTLTFADTTVTGSTQIANPVSGFSTYVNPIDGVVSEFGDALLINFNWGTTANENLNTYRGAVFFDVASGNRLVFVGEAEAEGANPKVLTAVMTKSE